MGDNSVMEFLTKYYEFLNESHGEINYTNYGAYIFSLFFLRHIYCKFQEVYIELVEEGDGWEDDSHVYESVDIFYVPPTSRWDYIVKNATSKEIGYIIKYAMIGIERENKPLNKLRKELQFTFLDRLVNGQKNVSSIIYLINDEKTNDDIFWFKILKRIYMDIVYFEKSNKFVILDDIIYDIEYFNQYYDFERFG